MAKSIRSKVKKKHRSYMRQTIGEKVRTKNIEAAAKRLADKKKGRGNTKTLSYIKGALGCLLYTSPSPRDKRQSRMPSSA